jgi:predicted DCC family thiol-disulfide oxidoreductase YuxK
MSAEHLTLEYDEDCGFCRWSAERLRRWDRRGRLTFAPIQSAVIADAAPATTDAAYRWVARRRSMLGRLLGQHACAVDPNRSGGGPRR